MSGAGEAKSDGPRGPLLPDDGGSTTASAGDSKEDAPSEARSPPELSAAERALLERGYKANVRRGFVALLCSSTTMAISLGPLFDAFLLNLGRVEGTGNFLVGAVESTRGLLELIVAFPIGHLSDRMPRGRLLRRNTPPWTVGLIVVTLGVHVESKVIIFIGMLLWAPGEQCFNATGLVLMAESVPTRQRTQITTNLASVTLLATALGPLLQFILLLILQRDHWENYLLKWVLLLGCLVWPGVVWVSCFIEDLPPYEERLGASAGASSAAAAGAQPQESQADGAGEARALQPAGGALPEAELNRRILGVKARWLMAAALEVISLFTACGAGMTVKFFPLFFRLDYGFTPAQVCLLSFAYPLSIAFVVQGAKKVSGRFSRLTTVTVMHFLGTSCLWAMCLCKSLPVVLTLYIVRGALMNGCSPLERAMVLDLVPAERRGRWNSIQSVSYFSWAGSAVIGGKIADASGDYKTTFVVTATIYSLVWLLYLPLFLIYPKERGGRSEG